MRKKKIHIGNNQNYVLISQGSLGQHILLHANSPLIFTAYCDSHWVSCSLCTAQSHGIFFSLGGSLMSWKIKKQSTESRSSVKAEYRSIVVTLCELKWLHRLLLDLRILVTGPIFAHCDNKAAIYVVENRVFMNKRSTQRLTVTLFEMISKQILFCQVIFVVILNLLIFLLKLYICYSFTHFFASWVFIIFMLPHENIGNIFPDIPYIENILNVYLLFHM